MSNAQAGQAPEADAILVIARSQAHRIGKLEPEHASLEKRILKRVSLLQGVSSGLKTPYQPKRLQRKTMDPLGIQAEERRANEACVGIRGSVVSQIGPP